MSGTDRSTPGDGSPLWPERYLTDGRILITPRRRSERRRAEVAGRWTATVRDQVVGLDWLTWIGREWSRMSSGMKLVLAVVIFLFTAGVGLLVPLAGVLRYRYVRDNPPPGSPTPVGTPLSPEAALATWDTTEARIAGAASRAWSETLREPAWHSPFLAQSRAAFDGQAEVDQIVDLALRIRNARLTLGVRPAGPAAEYWDRQDQALETAARQLGNRADALIRYRDQAAQLSAELQQLTELERLERSAAEIDGLTVETAYAPGAATPGMGPLTEEIAGIRMAMTELVDLMTRTRAPLAQPPGPLPDDR
ncbi:hypothetical protein [Blastococcus sp. SYSU DS0619]